MNSIHSSKTLFLLITSFLLLHPQGQLALAEQSFDGYQINEITFHDSSVSGEILEPVLAAERTASLLLETASSTFSQDELVSTTLYLDPGGTPVNLVNSVFTYTTSTLALVGIDYSESGFSIFLNNQDATGTVSITALQPNPGVIARTKVAKIIFKTISLGTSTLEFIPDSRAFANDGFGTDVLKQVNQVDLETIF
ncbi:hypothetical protein HGA64_03635 [Candidatus Falkowbacteria bacterium]|nr:hypothetical protein [Candidatus Falkowbacteria bacterium]